MTITSNIKKNVKVTSPTDFSKQEPQSSLLSGMKILTPGSKPTVEFTFSVVPASTDGAFTIPELP